MVNNKFEAGKLKIVVKKSGDAFEIIREVYNEIKEPVGESSLGSFKGLYHEVVSSALMTEGEAAQFVRKKSPAILCLFEDAKDIELGDKIVLTKNKKSFKVRKVENVQEWSILSNVILEDFEYGT